jgi:hypothetical protein
MDKCSVFRIGDDAAPGPAAEERKSLNGRALTFSEMAVGLIAISRWLLV